MYRHPIEVHNTRQSMWGPYKRPRRRWPRVLAAVAVAVLVHLLV